MPDETTDPATLLATLAGEYNAAAHDEAVQGRVIDKARKKRHDAQRRKSDIRGPLAEAIVSAFTSGALTQAQIVEITKYSRERVRQILNDAGTDPDERIERARASRRRS